MSLFEQILSTNIINFLIVLSTLYWIAKKLNIGGIIEKMADEVRLDIEKSAQEAKNAISEYKETKKSLKNTPELQAQIITSAKESAQNLKEKIEEKTKKQQSDIENSLSKILKNQNEKFKKTTTKEIYLACVDLAQREVVKKLDSKMQSKLIDFSIEELDKIEGSNLEK